jgi:threonine dehydrogenase-like Zn-dependent dehydrogenase
MRGQRLVAFRPNTMELEPFDLPDTPPPGHVLAETTCTLISTGTELANYTGITVDRRAMGADWHDKPYRPGYSYVGVVRTVGSGVHGISVGDRVCGHGPHASLALLEPSNVAVVPEGVTDVQAAFVTLVIITMNAVRLAKIELGERVVAVGLGLIGNIALQLARVCGAMPVVGTDLLATRRGYGERVGLLALDPAASDFAQQIAAFTEAEMFDVVFEATGSPAGLKPALQLARRHGRIVALGSTRGIVEQFDLYGDVHVPGVTIIGAHIMTHPAEPNFANRWTMQANRAVALGLLADRRVDVDTLVSHREPAERAPDLFALLAERRSEAMGCLLDWRRSG